MDITVTAQSQPSSSLYTDGMNDEGSSERPSKRKRNRQKASCRPCQRKKTKCDREEPCDACLKRNNPRHCIYDPPLAPNPTPAADLASQLMELRRRVDMLERRPCSHESSSSSSYKPQQPPTDSYSPASSSHTTTSARVLSNGRRVKPEDDEKIGFVVQEQQVGNGDADTEAAVQALEDLALGRKLYHPLGLNSEIPTLGNMPLGESNSEISRSAQNSTKPDPPNTRTSPNAFTTILLSNSSSKTMGLYESLPLSKEISDCLTRSYFEEVGWMYSVVVKSVFLAECEEFWNVLQEGKGDRVDPAWIAVYYQILCWSISIVHHPTRPASLQSFTVHELKSWADKWERSAKDALEVADWTGRAQVRTLQAMCLRLSYQRPSSESTNSSGQSAKVERIGFYIWLSAAVRIAQLMKLHKLGNDPNKMPLDDPAWPSQACGLKRELAKRIWFFVVSFDWIFCYSAGLGQIGVGSFDTDLPINVDDDDLGWDIIVQSRPLNYLSDVSFITARYALGRYQVRATDFSKSHSALDYDLLCELDSDIQANIALLDAIDPLSNPGRKPYHRDLLLSILHNRVLRLHRPFFIRGWRDEKYARSSVACVQSATQICAGMEKLGEGSYEHLWWISAYYMAALIVVFMNILRTEQLSPFPQTISPQESLLHSARHFFHRSCTTEHSPSVRQISSQAHSIVEHILLSRQISGSGHPLPRPPAARIFRDIAEKVRTPANKSGFSIGGGGNGFGYETEMLPPTVLPEVVESSFEGMLGFVGGLGEGFEGIAPLTSQEDEGDGQEIDWEQLFGGGYQ